MGPKIFENLYNEVYKVIQDRHVQIAMGRLTLSKAVIEDFPEEMTFEFCFGG